MVYYVLLFVVHVSSFVFEDFDCKFAESSEAMTQHNFTWTTLHNWLVYTPNDPTNEQLVVFLSESSLCPLGTQTACLLLHLRDYPCNPRDSVPSVRALIATSWPYLTLLQAWQDLLAESGQMVSHCDDLFHPSLVWAEYRERLTTGLTQWGPSLEEALMDAHAVAWKAGCGAVHEATGMTVSHLTSMCGPGVTATHLVRALGLALAPPQAGDTMRIVELYLHEVDRFLSNFLDEFVSTRWPLVFGLSRLHEQCQYRMRRSSIAFDPVKLVNTRLEYVADSIVVLVHVSNRHLDLLRPLIERYKTFNVSVHVITDSDQGYNLCRTLGDAVGINVDCLTGFSTNGLFNKYLYMKLFAENAPRVFFHTADFVPVQNFITALPGPEEAWDIGFLPDLFSRLNSENVMLFSNSEISRKFLDAMLTYVFRAPFPDERGAVHYLLDKSDGYGLVPGVSYLKDTIANVRRVSLARFFVTSEGFASSEPALVYGIDTNAEFDSKFLYSITSEAAIEQFLMPKRHGSFVKSLKRYTSSDEPIARDLHTYNRSEIVSNKRAVCPSAEAVEESDARSEITDETFIYHVNFAYGCCAEDQQLSSASAVNFFANESRALDGSVLDEAFLQKNAALLNFDRSRLMTSKTPSGTKGYYVWKPYAILKGICDLPYGSIVVYTDAGVQFHAPFRPLLKKYLAVSDMTAVETEMLEQARSKRDAFLILDADLPSIATTPQVASAIIAFRKTPNTVAFLEWWLAALESRHVITEEPSLMGPEYEGFVNSNDDQTGFSLLFKKFGYIPFSFVERNRVITMARNVAKFVAASDSFALGQTVDVDKYKDAADKRARDQLNHSYVL